MDIDVSLTVHFKDLYNQEKMKGIVFVPDTRVAKIVLIKMYNKLISEGMLVPIELLDQEEKIKLTKEVRMMKDTHFTNETLKTQCRILHLINLINEQ